MKRTLYLSLIAAASLGCSQPKTKQVAMEPATPEPVKTQKVTAPATFNARFKTSQGEFTIEVHRDWSPNGADRFYELVKSGYYDGVPFFRVISGFMVQFGISGDPEANAQWRENRIADDPSKPGISNKRGYVSFATGGPNTRTSQVFINFGDNGRLDGMGFTPFGVVVKGQNVVDSLYAGYGEGAPRGMGPDQERLQKEGAAYYRKDFPKLDEVRKATIE